MAPEAPSDSFPCNGSSERSASVFLRFKLTLRFCSKKFGMGMALLLLVTHRSAGKVDHLNTCERETAMEMMR